MLRYHTIELRPTSEQAQYFARCAGTMRFVFNRLVSKAQESGVKYNRKEFQKTCAKLRQTTPWMQEVNSRATYEACDNFHRAITNFFKSQKGERKGRKVGFPNFKKKGNKDSFQFSHSTQFKVEDRKLRIMGLKSTILMRERVRFSGTVKTVTVKFHAGKWFASFLVDFQKETPSSQEAMQKPRTTIGIDFGLSRLAALSTGEFVENPRHLRRSLSLLRKRQRQADRKVNGSNRRKIALRKVARLHKKVSDRRKAFHHAFANSIITRASRVVIEDLNVGGMKKNRKLARAISDAGWGTMRAILDYKCLDAGIELIIADRFFASSKICSNCGVKKESLKLSQRKFHCDACGFACDRDTNAAVNLSKYNLAPPIRGSRKTDAKGICQTSSEAVPSDCVNNNHNKTLRNLHNVPQGQTAEFY